MRGVYYQKKEDYSQDEKKLHAELFRDIAEWIVYEDDSKVDHVIWLLGQLEELWKQEDMYVMHEYSDILQMLTKRKGEYNNGHS